MGRSRITAALLPLGVAASIALAGCISEPVSQRAADEQICLHHAENNPEEQARCRLDPALRHGTPPDLSPKELPVRIERRN